MLAATVRSTTTRRLPAFATARVSAVRFYAEGDTARSREFSKKERAHEDQYIKQHEAEQMKKLRAQIAAKKAELENLEKEHEKLEKSK